MRALLLLPVLGVALAGAPAHSQDAASATAQGQDAGRQAVEQGERFFLGQARFANGGPPCGSCHQLSTLRFPNGGVLGPDLSPASGTLGPEGLDVTLKTLFFPTMMPLYEGKPLTPDEQQSLKALLQQAGPPGPGPWITLALSVAAAAGFLLLTALTWLAWRNRLGAVRAPLVRRAMAGGLRP